MPSTGARDDLPATLVVVRHGATEWSRNGRHTGRTDLPLDADGLDQAAALEPRLAELGLGWPRAGTVYSSPLKRALETCRMAGAGEAVTVDERLAEWDYGRYEGMTSPEIEEVAPGWRLFSDGCPGGESVSQVRERADAFLASLRGLELTSSATVWCFSHGHFSRVLAARWLGFDTAQGSVFELGTAGIGVLGWSHGEPVVDRWNL